MTITYFGHSALQAETGGTTLLFDPFISDNPMAEGVVTADELAPDVVLLTHAHFDHYGDTEPILERTGALLVAQFEIMSYVQKQIEHEAFQPMNTGGTASFDWGRVTNTYARHSSSFGDGTYGGLAGRRSTTPGTRRTSPRWRTSASGSTSTWRSCPWATCSRWGRRTPSAPRSCSSRS